MTSTQYWSSQDITELDWRDQDKTSISSDICEPSQPSCDSCYQFLFTLEGSDSIPVSDSLTDNAKIGPRIRRAELAVISGNNISLFGSLGLPGSSGH